MHGYNHEGGTINVVLELILRYLIKPLAVLYFVAPQWLGCHGGLHGHNKCPVCHDYGSCSVTAGFLHSGAGQAHHSLFDVTNLCQSSLKVLACGCAGFTF